MKTFPGLWLIYFLIITFSCTHTNSEKVSLPSVSGSAGEMLIVIDKTNWRNSLGDTIRYVFSSLMPVTVMEEPYFNLIQVPESGINNTLKRHRNIFMVSLDVKGKQGIYFKSNLWASSQIVGKLIAPSADSAIQMLIRDGEAIRNKFINIEIERWIQIFQNSHDDKIIAELQKTHAYWLTIPKGYSLDVNKDHFFWISKESKDVIIGITGWDYPYISKDQLKPENLIRKRNEIVKTNVPGPITNSYMTTELAITPVINETIYKGLYLVHMEGLWKLEGAFMGGPFINYTTIDTKNNRIITIEGFIHTSRAEKRNLLRQLSAVLYSFQLEKSVKGK
jgi:hypothetical protein